MKRLKTEIVTPEQIVDDAKNPKRAYHEYFEWDDLTAAHEHRVQQAREMTRSIVQVRIINNEEKPIRAFYNIVRGDNKGYGKQEYVFKHDDLRRQILDKAMKEVVGWRQRYNDYSELSKIHSAIDETVRLK